MPGVFVTGTQDGVGKTAVACGMLGALRERGLRVAPFKPVEPGWSGPEGSWPPDVTALRAASGMQLRLEEIAPYVLKEPMVPVLAADRAGRTIDVKFLDRAYESLAQRSDLVVLDACGGLATPLRRDPWFTMADLAFNWGMPVLIVCPAGPAGVNQAVLTAEYARRKGLTILGLLVNGMPDEASHPDRANPEVIAAMCGIPLLGALPRRPDVDVAAGRWQPMVGLVGKGMDLWRIQSLAKVAAR